MLAYMALETTLRLSLLLPNFIQAGNNEPRKVHLVGSREPVPQEQNRGGSNQDNQPKRKDPRGYRDLSTITIGEVNDARQYFASQLTPSLNPSWIAQDYFCIIHLSRR